MRRTEPLAYLLTWTTYGQWLHGDQRGSVDRDHHAAGAPFAPSSSRRQSVALSRLQHPAVELGAAHRQVVSETIAIHCEIRGWELVAANVRTNHVHVVVGYPGLKPEGMLAQFKAWTTRRLREGGLVPLDGRVWTAHGSTRYLWTPSDVSNAAAYVTERQGNDLPGSSASVHPR